MTNKKLNFLHFESGAEFWTSEKTKKYSRFATLVLIVENKCGLTLI